MADLGQVFTKGNVARYMVSLFDLPKQAAIMEIIIPSLIQGYEKLKGTPLQGMLAFAG